MIFKINNAVFPSHLSGKLLMHAGSSSTDFPEKRMLSEGHHSRSLFLCNE
jgi:hypothetical protein